MTIKILMPALSPTMEEGTLTKWLVKEGDMVESGDIMAEIETDKATMEFEAVDEGIISKILIPDGSENVAVNTPIAILLEDGESLTESNNNKSTDKNAIKPHPIINITTQATVKVTSLIGIENVPEGTTFTELLPSKVPFIINTIVGALVGSFSNMLFNFSIKPFKVG